MDGMQNLDKSLDEALEGVELGDDEEEEVRSADAPESDDPEGQRASAASADDKAGAGDPAVDPKSDPKDGQPKAGQPSGETKPKPGTAPESPDDPLGLMADLAESDVPDSGKAWYQRLSQKNTQLHKMQQAIEAKMAEIERREAALAGNASPAAGTPEKPTAARPDEDDDDEEDVFADPSERVVKTLQAKIAAMEQRWEAQERAKREAEEAAKRARVNAEYWRYLDKVADEFGLTAEIIEGYYGRLPEGINPPPEVVAAKIVQLHPHLVRRKGAGPAAPAARKQEGTGRATLPGTRTAASSAGPTGKRKPVDILSPEFDAEIARALEAAEA